MKHVVAAIALFSVILTVLGTLGFWYRTFLHNQAYINVPLWLALLGWAVPVLIGIVGAWGVFKIVTLWMESK